MICAYAAMICPLDALIRVTPIGSYARVSQPVHVGLRDGGVALEGQRRACTRHYNVTGPLKPNYTGSASGTVHTQSATLTAGTWNSGSVGAASRSSKMTSASERALPSSRVSNTETGTRLTHANQLSSRSLHPPPVVGPPSPVAAALQPRCCCRPRRRAVAVAATPLSAALSPAQSTSAAAPMVAGTCVARAHACVRYGAWTGCGAHSESTSSIALPPPRQPLLSGHKSD